MDANFIGEAMAGVLAVTFFLDRKLSQMCTNWLGDLGGSLGVSGLIGAGVEATGEDNWEPRMDVNFVGGAMAGVLAVEFFLDRKFSQVSADWLGDLEGVFGTSGLFWSGRIFRWRLEDSLCHLGGKTFLRAGV